MRHFDCRFYDRCLTRLAKRNSPIFSCRGCRRYIPDEPDQDTVYQTVRGSWILNAAVHHPEMMRVLGMPKYSAYLNDHS